MGHCTGSGSEYRDIGHFRLGSRLKREKDGLRNTQKKMPNGLDEISDSRTKKGLLRSVLFLFFDRYLYP